LAVIAAGERWHEAENQAAEARARSEELHALESAFRHQTEANQQVVQGLLGCCEMG